MVICVLYTCSDPLKVKLGQQSIYRCIRKKKIRRDIIAKLHSYRLETQNVLKNEI